MKKVVRLTESDLIKLVKRIVEDENEVEDNKEYLYYHPASMGFGKWYRNTLMNKGEPEEFPNNALKNVKVIPIENVGDDVIARRFRKFYENASPYIIRAELI